MAPTLSFRRAVSMARAQARDLHDPQSTRAVPMPGDDVDAIVELVESAYRGEASRAGWTTEADLLDGQRTDRAEVESLVAGPRSRIVLAFMSAGASGAGPAVQPALVGSALLELSASVAYVGMVSVRPDCQARGVGRALLAECERIVRAEQPGSKLRMTVIGQRAELIAWYERRGFARTGERAAFPYGQPRFGLPRRQDLYFEVLEKELSARVG